MQRFSKSPKTFNLLSIGQRGVGKTVFLAGSYAQLQNNASDLAVKVLASIGVGSNTPSTRRSSDAAAFWFECQDEDREALEKILHHIRETGLYPPATIKITNFYFRLKQRTAQGVETVCDFRWSDIPGESGNLRNSEFQEIVLTSHACCVFINAKALLHDPDYAATLQDSFNQVIAIASLIDQHRLNYAIALIFTQCDLLDSKGATQLELEQKLKPMLRRLDEIKANYRCFYSAIPIEMIDGDFTLNARGAADPLLWLLTELEKRHRFQPEQNLATRLSQPQVGQKVPSRLGRAIVVLIMTSISLGIGVSLLFGLGLVKTPPSASTQEQAR